MHFSCRPTAGIAARRRITARRERARRPNCDERTKGDKSNFGETGLIAFFSPEKNSPPRCPVYFASCRSTRPALSALSRDRTTVIWLTTRDSYFA